MNYVCGGDDHPTDNSGMGSRVILHLLSKSGIEGHTNGEVGRALYISTGGGGTSYLRYAIHIGEASGTIDTAIRLDTTGDYGIRSFGAKVVADIDLGGDSAYGILCRGTYTSAAIRIATDQYIGLETTNAVKLRYDTAQSEFEVVNAGTERFAVSLDSTPYISLNNTQVVRERITGWSAATGTKARTTFVTSSASTADIGARLGALIDDLITHGLIGT
jgi:hypothetical protein